MRDASDRPDPGDERTDRPGGAAPGEEDVGRHLAAVLSGGGRDGSGGGDERAAQSGAGRGLEWLSQLTGQGGKLVTTTDPSSETTQPGSSPGPALDGAFSDAFDDEEPSGPSDGQQDAPAGEEDDGDRATREVLADRVVRDLLQQGVVSARQVRAALEEKTPGQPLWRAVAALREVDTDMLLDAARARDLAPPRAPRPAHYLPSRAFARYFQVQVRAGAFTLDAPSTSRISVRPLVQAGLLPGLDHLGDAADGSARGEEPVANISEEWAEPDGDGAAEAPEAPPAPGEQMETGDRVVTFLLRKGRVDPQQVAEAQRLREKQGGSEALWRLLAHGENVDRAAVFAEAARVYAFPAADLEAHPPESDFTRTIADHFSDERREELIELGLAPWRIEVDQQRSSFKLFLITHDPARPAVHRLAHALDVDRVELQYAPEEDVQALLADAFPRTNEYLERVEDEDEGMDLGASYDDGEDGLIDEEALEAEISRSKLINLFEATLVEAVRGGASDIHIFPNPRKEVEIHFRTDGRLHPWHTEKKVHPEALLAVIKDNSMNVDRFEKDAAQDGFIQRNVDGALIRFRVSIMPIATAAQDVRAESIVIRVLDDRKVITDLSKLGLQENALDKFRHAIDQPHGMVIMTGPTGSGKSTTLVAALHEVVTGEVNVLTVEDPVEYVINDVRQIKLSHKLRLSEALRSILRHDPDVVMVGEMRDRETAELAIKLANTGHLTFSTLHTNDAPSAVSRLYKMQIEPFLIAYAINLIVAQRLIRTLCSDCKTVDDDPDRVMLDRLGFTEEEIRTMDFYTEGHDDNCPTCHGFGYKGRRAISEALHFSRDIRHMIVSAGDTIDEDSIREQALSEGMFTLQGSARQVVKSGETSVQEMMRVVATEA